MYLKRGSEELLPVYQNCVFRSDERVASHYHVANELSEHTLRWKRGAVDVAMFKRELQQIEMFVLRYGAEVEVRPRPFEQFALAHMSLRGAAEMTIDGTQVAVGEGRTAFIAPRHDVSLRWHAGTEQLIIKLPIELLRRVDESYGSLRGAPPAFLIPNRFNSQWQWLVRSVLNLVRLPGDAGLNPEWQEHFERNLALFLLKHGPGAAEDQLAASGALASDHALESADAASTDARRIDALLAYMESHLNAPVSLTDLAAAAGVSERTLNALCHRHLGETPMNYLRDMRLDAVRAKLRLLPNVSITATAMDHGFAHHGRFSAYYFRRFGELPSQTVRQDHGEDSDRNSTPQGS